MLQFESEYGDLASTASVEQRRADAVPKRPAQDVLHTYLMKYRCCSCADKLARD